MQVSSFIVALETLYCLENFCSQTDYISEKKLFINI